MGESLPLSGSSNSESEGYFWQSASDEDQETCPDEVLMAQGVNSENQPALVNEEKDEWLDLIMDKLILEAVIGDPNYMADTLSKVNSEDHILKLRDFMVSSRSPLMHALQHGNRSCVRLLMDAFTIDPHQMLPVKTMLPLNIAAEKGHDDVVQLLLDRGANINATLEEDGRTPLYEACCHGHVSTVKYLLERGADPNIAAVKDVSCLEVAAFKRKRRNDTTTAGCRGRSLEQSSTHILDVTASTRKKEPV